MTFLLVAALLAPPRPAAQLYDKLEYRIPMRDGIKLYTAVYVPKKDGKFPVLMERTPYSAGPYGPNRIPDGFGGSDRFVQKGTIFVVQDVRGRHMSQGKFVEVRPVNPNPTGTATDETTDAYDTVDYLVKNVPKNNGRVGLWGISYPGFYAAAAGIRSHPAVKAVSPQAPVTEWWFGDDVHHNGAFFLLDNFDFYFFFGTNKDAPAAEHPQIEPYGPRPDAYKFFMDLGNSANAEAKYFKGRIPFWNDIMKNDRYNEFWKARSIRNHFKGVQPAMLTVGGWFDAEDLYGTLATYQSLEKNNPKLDSTLVMGPWDHGGWYWGAGSGFGSLRFGQATAAFYREQIEFPFFDAYLFGDGKFARPEAWVFQTGANKWREFPVWPPKEAKPFALHLGPKGTLARKAATSATGSDKYVSDPANPIPFQPGTIRERRATYMVEDQRFLSDRKDILRYETEPLGGDLTVAGPITADLYVKTTGTDLDLIAKVIDKKPDGTETLIRWEVMRAKFRGDASNPTPLTPGKIERVRWTLNDLCHTFVKGNRLQVQIQSSWFPLIDRNPQTFTNIHFAKPEQYKAATVEVMRTKTAPSRLVFGRLP
jgi:uncharacterized protein